MFICGIALPWSQFVSVVGKLGTWDSRVTSVVKISTSDFGLDHVPFGGSSYMTVHVGRVIEEESTFSDFVLQVNV